VQECMNKKTSHTLKFLIGKNQQPQCVIEPLYFRAWTSLVFHFTVPVSVDEIPIPPDHNPSPSG